MTTLFIVGAGASADFGLPVGARLQKDIANFLRPDPHSEDFGRDINFAWPTLSNLGLKWNDLLQTLEWMSRTLPLARSIDSFLEAQSMAGDAISFLGKYAIATLISRAEKATRLFVPNRIHKPNFQALSQSWLGQLWPMINKGGAAQIDEKGLEGFEFLTFNYDRCIEQFLFLAFTDFYRMPVEAAVELVETVKIRHVYGSLGGALPRQNGLPFGYEELSDQRIRAAHQIKTYSEQLEETDLQDIGHMLGRADRIIFLGFSFAPMNTELLASACTQSASLKQIFGTAYKMSEFDREKAQDWCCQTFRRGHSFGRLDNETGTEFFQSHQLLF